MSDSRLDKMFYMKDNECFVSYRYKWADLHELRNPSENLFKLRLNFHHDDFNAHRKNISDIIKNLILLHPRTVVCFKYCKFGTEEYVKPNEISASDQFNIQRFHHSAQFTLYLARDYDVRLIKLFLLELEKYLNQAKFRPGHTNATDVALNPFSFVAVRQECFLKDKVYIPATESDELLGALKLELMQSSFYKSLNTKYYRSVPVEQMNDDNSVDQSVTPITRPVKRLKRCDAFFFDTPEQFKKMKELLAIVDTVEIPTRDKTI